MQREPSTIAKARSLRGAMTDAEKILWSRLRDRRFGGHKFVRQMPVGPYIADFGCREAKVIKWTVRSMPKAPATSGVALSWLPAGFACSASGIQKS